MELTIPQALAFARQFALHGNHEGAIGTLRGVLVHEPDNVEALLRLGASLFDTNKPHEALFNFWRAKKLHPHNCMALSNHGLTLAHLGEWQEGCADLERAIRHAEKMNLPNPVKAITYNNLGNVLERLGRYKDALAALDKGIFYNPADAFPYYNRGIVLMRLGRYRDGIVSLKQALALHKPSEHSTSRLNPPDAYYNLGMSHLLLGELGEGFAAYEGRLQTSENGAPDFGLDPKLKWKLGDSVEGKIVLLHCEQGLGDTIQSLRFLPQLVALGTKEIVIIAHQAMRPLIDIPGVRVLQPGEKLKGATPDITAVGASYVTDNQKVAEIRVGESEEGGQVFDCWCALMSLPLYLGVKREDQIPAPWRCPVEPERFEQMEIHVNPLHSPRVGICWAGNFQHKNDAHRSIPLADFATLFDAPASFVSLQQVRPGEVDEFEAVKGRHNILALSLTDFRDTAAVMLNLDLVITVDTAVAHMAASLGVPTWILIPAFSTDWRWQLNRTDSPWYPRATLYRQPKVGDWSSVLDRVKRDLIGTAAQRVAANAA